MSVEVFEHDCENSCNEMNEKITGSCNNDDCCTKTETLAFKLVDSNSNGIHSENVIGSPNLQSRNVSTDEVASISGNTEISLSLQQSEVVKSDPGSVGTLDVIDTSERNSDIIETDSVIFDETGEIDHSEIHENYSMDVSFNQSTNSSGDAKDLLDEHGDILKQEFSDRDTERENEVNSSDIPNGITKTALSSDLKSISSAKCTSYTKKKLKKIWVALEKNDIDFLKEAAITRGGLLNDDVRKKVWPKLVGADVVETSPRPCLDEIKAHPYYQQVVLDVNRSLKRFPPSIKEAQRLMMLDQLVFLIMRVLCRHPELHYYQGYHDICVTFLLVLGEEIAFHVVEKLSRTHLNVFMEKTMEPTIHLLEYIYMLIGKKNPLLKSFLLKSEVGVAYCLSWLITWFGHVLNDYDNVVRLFDLFIVSHPWMPMYLTSVVVLYREIEIFKQECDMASVHSLLANIPDDLPFEDLILLALSLHKNFTPKMLSYERPFIKRSKGKTNTGWRLIQSVTKTIKSAVPASNITLPLVLAAAVLVTAVLYQVYKH